MMPEGAALRKPLHRVRREGRSQVPEGGANKEVQSARNEQIWGQRDSGVSQEMTPKDPQLALPRAVSRKPLHRGSMSSTPRRPEPRASRWPEPRPMRRKKLLRPVPVGGPLAGVPAGNRETKAGAGAWAAAGGSTNN